MGGDLIMSYKEIINSYQAIDYSKYKDITSYEKLMLYVARELKKSKVPLTFNYLCVATFKIPLARSIPATNFLLSSGILSLL